MDKKVIKEIESLNEKQLLKALGLLFSEEGLKRMLTDWTVGSMPAELYEEDKKQCREYLRLIRLAKTI